MEYSILNYIIAFGLLLLAMTIAGGFTLGVFYLLPRRMRKRILEAVDNGEI